MRVLASIVLMMWMWAALAQERKITVSFSGLTLEEVFALVTENSGYYFSYNSDIIPASSRFEMNVQDVGIDQFLNKLLLGTGLMHQVMGDQIIIRQAPLVTNQGTLPITFSINGRVLDSLTREPIVGANVFLSGTNLGGVTDMEGYYAVDRIPFGSYEVIFTHLAYKMNTWELEMQSPGVLTVNADLKQDTRVLDTLTVVSKRLVRPEERARFVRMFERDFLGQSRNATGCRILNPDVLDFIYDPKENKLEVFALEPVRIVNEHLGYAITYHFDVFQRIGDFVNFYGRARFENMDPKNGREARQWVKNRRKAYEGSFLMFRRALVRDELKKQRFEISLFKTEDFNELDQAQKVEVSRDNVLMKMGPDNYALIYDGLLLVTYRRKPDNAYDMNILDGEENRRLQRSVLQLNADTIGLRANGRMEYPGVATYGYWYWERIADLLPENYNPDIEEF